MSRVRFDQGRHDRAKIGYVLLATLLYYAGKPLDGLEKLDIASRLNPLYPSNYPFHRGQALFILERYDEALQAFEFGLSQNPTAQRLRVWLVATLVQLDRLEDAQWEASEILLMDPDFRPAQLDGIFPFQERIYLERFNSALSRAGFEHLVGTDSN